MTVLRCAEDESRTGIHDRMEFSHVMVANSIEETVKTVQPTGYKCINQFLSTSIFYLYFVINHNHNKILIGPLLSAVLLRKLTNNTTE